VRHAAITSGYGLDSGPTHSSRSRINDSTTLSVTSRLQELDSVPEWIGDVYASIALERIVFDHLHAVPLEP
jgi:hypothetical protein